MSPLQCRVARAALDISQRELGELAGVTRGMVADFEGQKRSTIHATRFVVQAALEGEGVIFRSEAFGRSSVLFFDPIGGGK